MPRNSQYTVTLSQSNPVKHRLSMREESPRNEPWYESRMGAASEDNLLKYLIVKSPLGAPDMAKISETHTGVTIAVARHPQPMPVAERILLEIYSTHIYRLSEMSSMLSYVAKRFEDAAAHFSDGDWQKAWRIRDHILYDKDRIADDSVVLPATQDNISDLALIAGIEDVAAWYEGLQDRIKEVAAAAKGY